MQLATFKHISSKNADYSAAEAYLTFEHDEFTMKPTLDENGRLMLKTKVSEISSISWMTGTPGRTSTDPIGNI